MNLSSEDDDAAAAAAAGVTTRPTGTGLCYVEFIHRVTTGLENLEMSGNLTTVREMSDFTKRQGNVGKKSCQVKVV